MVAVHGRLLSNAQDRAGSEDITAIGVMGR
jgi:hypothetical protein